jgi:hypothetical protein
LQYTPYSNSAIGGTANNEELYYNDFEQQPTPDLAGWSVSGYNTEPPQASAPGNHYLGGWTGGQPSQQNPPGFGGSAAATLTSNNAPPHAMAVISFDLYLIEWDEIRVRAAHLRPDDGRGR